MGTNAVVSVVRNGSTIVKAVTGCDGGQAQELAGLIARRRCVDALSVVTAARDCGFGCNDCLVVMDDNDEIYAADADELKGSLYYTKFRDPVFNPRWDLGTAAYVFTVDADSWTVENKNQ